MDYLGASKLEEIYLDCLLVGLVSSSIGPLMPDVFSLFLFGQQLPAD